MTCVKAVNIRPPRDSRSVRSVLRTRSRRQRDWKNANHVQEVDILNPAPWRVVVVTFSTGALQEIVIFL